MKIHENPSQGSEDMEPARNSRINPLTLTCDLELGSWVMCFAHSLTKRYI